jgi:DsbC/DsbD-like thiol-disulfide interchange protein
MLIRLSLLALTLLASPALAGATAWQEIAPGAKARLISSDVLEDGRTLAGLELDMASSTKTYWRIPGETGIPTEIDLAGSEGIGGSRIDWPYPTIDRQQGYFDYVYYGPLVLPLALDIDTGAATLRASVTMGICTDVCMPARAEFTLPLSFGKADAAEGIRLTQALAATPIAWDKPDEPFGAVTLSADGKAIALAAPAASIDPATLIADAGDPGLLFGAPQKSPDGTIWTLPLLGGVNGMGLQGRPNQLTFMTADGPYVVSRAVAPAGTP